MQASKWIGVDIHKKQLTVCVLADGKEPKHLRYERTSDGIREFLKEVDGGSVVGIESTTWTRDLAKKLEGSVKEVIIFNTVELKEMMDKLKKTDREDAERIALILRRFEKAELSTCYLKTDVNAEVKGLLNIRENWVNRKVEAKNEFRSMLEYWGVETDQRLFYKSAKGIEKLEKENRIPEALKKALQELLIFILNTDEVIKGLNQEVASKMSGNEAYQVLIEKIIGIGSTSAAYIVTKVEDIGRFDNPKKLVSYFGLAPKVNQSDGKGFNGHISRRTDKAIIRVLVQAAWASVRYDPIMCGFYQSIRQRTGSQKAIIAVARKLIVFCYYVWKSIEI